MEGDTIGKVQSGIKALQADAVVGREALRTKGDQNGRNGRPMSSHNDLDSEELRLLAAYKNLLKDFWQRFREDIAKVIDGLDGRLFFHASGDEHKSTSGSSLGKPRIDEATAKLERIVESKRLALASASEKASESHENLSEFRETHQLHRPADLSRNRKRNLGIAAGAFAALSLVLSFLIRGWDAPLLAAGLWLVACLVIVGLSIVFAEACRAATNHFLKIRWAAYSVIFFLLIPVIGVVSLGLGHYRDALNSDPDQQLATQADGGESLEPSLPEQIDCSAIESPASEANCRVWRQTFRMEDLYSWLAVILGALLHLGVILMWFTQDDRYFRYGSFSRRSALQGKEWADLSGPVITSLDKEHQSLRASAEAAYVDLRSDWQTGTRRVDELHEGWRQSLAAICNACRDSIVVYRTANREARPPIVGVPPHWNEEWHFPLDDEYSLPRIEDLRGHMCTHEEAIGLAQKESENLNAVLSAIDAAHLKCRGEVDNLQPKPAVYPTSDPDDAT